MTRLPFVFLQKRKGQLYLLRLGLHARGRIIKDAIHQVLTRLCGEIQTINSMLGTTDGRLHTTAMTMQKSTHNYMNRPPIGLLKESIHCIINVAGDFPD